MCKVRFEWLKFIECSKMLTGNRFLLKKGLYVIFKDRFLYSCII